MVVSDAHVFPGFLTPVLTQPFFAKPLTTFLTCFRDERRKYAGKTVHLNRVSNLQPPGHESDKFTTEYPGRGCEKSDLMLLQTVSTRDAGHYQADMVPNIWLSTNFWACPSNTLPPDLIPVVKVHVSEH